MIANPIKSFGLFSPPVWQKIVGISLPTYRHHNYELCPDDHSMKSNKCLIHRPPDISLCICLKTSSNNICICLKLSLEPEFSYFSPSYLKWITWSKWILNPLRTNAPYEYKHSIEIGENSIGLRDNANPAIRTEKHKSHGHCHQKKPQRTPGGGWRWRHNTLQSRYPDCHTEATCVLHT